MLRGLVFAAVMLPVEYCWPGTPSWLGSEVQGSVITRSGRSAA